ncbi:uncharacterized protein LOC142320247 isoform X2 [Lycorma delicatula]|uniref:uncharacterized protein LOC142320247 isoform X2 n=1 Tax=Lycorma delicatula TaxID=130591 RepID=UPI003F50FFDF
MDLASTPVIKTDQTRNNPGAALLKNVPTHQGRFLTSVQQSTQTLTTTTPTLSAAQTQSVSKQVTINSSQGIVTSNAVISRLTSLPVHTSSTYHVPRGAAAVANIAVPRAPLATPIRGPSSNLQAIGVSSSANHSTLVRGNASTVGVRTTLQVASSNPWLTGISTTSSTTPRPTSTQTTIAPFSRATSMTVPRLTTPVVSRTLPETTQRPVLLQTTTHKQLNISQPPTQPVHINDKTFLKTGVGLGVGVRAQTTVAGTTVTRSASQPLNRIGSALPPVVSLHPTTVLVQSPPVPLKAQPSHTSKMLTQSPHIQIQSLPVNSIAPSTLTMTTVVTRPPVCFSTTSTMSGMPSTARTAPAVTSPCQSQASKVFSSESVFIQTTQHKSTSSVTGVVPGSNVSSIVSIGNPVYNLSSQPGSYTSYEPSTGYQMQRTNFSTNQASTPVVTTTSTRTPSGSCTQPVEALTCMTPTSQVVTPTKTNASPRPSILRKRDSEGSPLKAQKNLTPLLSTLTVVPPSSPPSPPKRPESRGNGGSQSSGGSTTISATSSPGLGTGDPDSPPIKQEPPDPPPIEMSPRKKPRKQQLTGNQMQEPKSEDEMEFISEEKIKREPKENSEDGVEIVAPKTVPKRPTVSLLNSYRHTWKSRHHHFLRYSDVKPKDERRPTVSDLANQKQVLQKIAGWKIYHLSSQMEDVSDLETEVFEKLTAMLKVLERKPGNQLDKDINRVNELIKGNIQRSKVIKDQMQEAKTQVMKIFDHKGHVTEILTRCVSKRSVKKRDRV